MYDPTPLARYYASRVQSFVNLANEGSSHSRIIYLRLAEVFDGLATSADRFAIELRGGAQLEQRKVEPEAPIHVPVPARQKRKPVARKTSSAQTPLPHAAVIDEARH
jgi:hypothetical protein